MMMIETLNIGNSVFLDDDNDSDINSEREIFHEQEETQKYRILDVTIFKTHRLCSHYSACI